MPKGKFIHKKGKLSNNWGKHWKVKDTSKFSLAMKKKWVDGRMKPGRLGKHCSEDHKRKMSLLMNGKPQLWSRGKKNCNWKGGITPFNKQIRQSLEYKLWRTAVFERDNYTCIWCGKRGVILNADHIKPFSQYPELRFAIDNGRTLCINCHSKTDTYKGKLNKIYGTGNSVY